MRQRRSYRLPGGPVPHGWGSEKSMGGRDVEASEKSASRLREFKGDHDEKHHEKDFNQKFVACHRCSSSTELDAAASVCAATAAVLVWIGKRTSGSAGS